MVAPDVGGGFGAKGARVEDVILGWLARATGRRSAGPRRAARTWSHCSPAGRWCSTSSSGRTATAMIDALKLDIVADAGAYPDIGAFLPNLTALMASGVYTIPKIERHDPFGLTNTTPTGACARRGPARGQPDARARHRPAGGRDLG